MLDPQIENIFSHAVALDQSGRMKNTIYCSGQTIFILNNEGTIILRFTIPSHLAPFKNPVSFKADDYEPGNLQEKGGRVIFTKFGEEFTRNKSCKVPERTFSDVEKIWDMLQARPHSTFTIHQKSLTLLDDGLSHLEISAEKGSLKIVQRVITEGAYLLQKEDTDRPPKTIQIIVPAGAAERVASGESIDLLPDNLVFVIGDTLEVINQDSTDHQLGPIWVPPGARVGSF